MKSSTECDGLGRDEVTHGLGDEGDVERDGHLSDLIVNAIRNCLMQTKDVSQKHLSLLE